MNKFLSNFKLIFITVTLLFCLPVFSYSQTVTAIYSGGTPSPGDLITIPIVIDDNGGAVSIDVFELHLNWNADILTYSTYTLAYPSLSGAFWTPPTVENTPNSKLYLGFGNTLTYTNQTIVNLKFIYHGGTAAVSFYANTDPSANGSSYIVDFVNLGDYITPNSFYSGSNVVGPLAPIASVAGGGNWSNGASWNLGHKPNTSNGTVTINSDVVTPLVLDEDVTTASNLVINTGKQLVVNTGKNLTVSGATTLNGSECLVLKSDISGTASFISNTTNGSGTAKVERFITGDKWHLLSSPITNATANVVTPAQTGTTTPVYLRQFSESTNAWSYITDVNTVLAPVKGYAIWADLTAGGATNPTITFTGTLNANASIPYTNSNSGWNLLGNPYTSALDWNAVTGKASLAGGAFYCWNSTSGKYSVSDGYAAVNQLNIVSPYSIPAMQGFFVKATAVGSLGISTAKIHSAIPYYKSSNSLNDMIRLTAQRGLFKDEALVVMNSSATNNYDEAYDASKFFANNTDIPEIYTLAGSEKIAINKIGSFPAVVPVNIKMGVADNVTITASDFANFDASVYIILEDMLNGTFQNLRQNPSYTFAAAVGENAGRFNLHFSYNALIVNDVKKENASIYSSNNTIYVNSSEKINDISVYNMLGQLIVNKASNLNAMNTITVQAANAYYIVKVTTVNGVYTEKVYVK